MEWTSTFARLGSILLSVHLSVSALASGFVPLKPLVIAELLILCFATAVDAACRHVPTD